MATTDDTRRLRQDFSAIRVSDHVNVAPPTPTTPTSRMHLLSGLRTAPKAETAGTVYALLIPY
jgi:hypothetical protein